MSRAFSAGSRRPAIAIAASVVCLALTFATSAYASFRDFSFSNIYTGFESNRDYSGVGNATHYLRFNDCFDSRGLQGYNVTHSLRRDRSAAPDVNYGGRVYVCSSTDVSEGWTGVGSGYIYWQYDSGPANYPISGNGRHTWP